MSNFKANLKDLYLFVSIPVCILPSRVLEITILWGTQFEGFFLPFRLCRVLFFCFVCFVFNLPVLLKADLRLTYGAERSTFRPRRVDFGRDKSIAI